MKLFRILYKVISLRLQQQEERVGRSRIVGQSEDQFLVYILHAKNWSFSIEDEKCIHDTNQLQVSFLSLFSCINNYRIIHSLHIIPTLNISMCYILTQQHCKSFGRYSMNKNWQILNINHINFGLQQLNIIVGKQPQLVVYSQYYKNHPPSMSSKFEKRALFSR